jgi:transposase
MLNKNQAERRKEIQIISIEDLVPQDHIIRDIDRAINLDFIYDEVKDLYSADIGRPSVDPVVLFKIVLLQYIFGIRSMRMMFRQPMFMTV